MIGIVDGFEVHGSGADAQLAAEFHEERRGNIERRLVEQVAGLWCNEVLRMDFTAYKDGDERLSARSIGAERTRARKMVAKVLSLVRRSGAEIRIGEVACSRSMIQAASMVRMEGGSLKEQIEAALSLLG